MIPYLEGIGHHASDKCCGFGRSAQPSSNAVFRISTQLGPCVMWLSMTFWTASARGIFRQRICSVPSGAWSPKVSVRAK